MGDSFRSTAQTLRRKSPPTPCSEVADAISKPELMSTILSACHTKILLPDGLKRVKIQPGAAGKAKASVAGLGTNLHLPSPMNVMLPALVQLQGENGVCVESTFTTAKQNVEDSFRAVNSPSAAFVDEP